MEPYKQIDAQQIASVPKQFCENTLVGYGPDFFTVGLATGSNITLFALSPEGAKRFALQLSKSVAEYEKKFRMVKEIPDIPSPFDVNDLGENKKT